MLETPNEPEGTEETTTETPEKVVKEVVTEEEVIEQIAEAVAEGNVDEVQELRSMLRDMKQDNLRMKIQLEKVLNVQNTEMGKEPAPGVLEALQNDLNAVAERRGESFSTLLEAMELNPKFEDVRTVCSAGNFNDIFETVAKIHAEENGTSLDEELMKAKLEVWKMPNPYKYMYETIKAYHPSYKVKEVIKEAIKEADVKGKTAKEVLEAAKVREKKPVVAPGTIANLSGSATEQGGWTAAKIDSLDEVELRKVPREVYSQWLNGELD